MHHRRDDIGIAVREAKDKAEDRFRNVFLAYGHDLTWYKSGCSGSHQQQEKLLQKIKGAQINMTP